MSIFKNRAQDVFYDDIFCKSVTFVDKSADIVWEESSTNATIENNIIYFRKSRKPSFGRTSKPLVVGTDNFKFVYDIHTIGTVYVGLSHTDEKLNLKLRVRNHDVIKFELTNDCLNVFHDESNKQRQLQDKSRKLYR